MGGSKLNRGSFGVPERNAVAPLAFHVSHVGLVCCAGRWDHKAVMIPMPRRTMTVDEMSPIPVPLQCSRDTEATLEKGGGPKPLASAPGKAG